MTSSSFFELYQARLWSLYALNSHHNVKRYLDISDIIDPSWEWFLKDIPQYNGSKKLDEWKAKRESGYLVYSKEVPTFNHTPTTSDEVYIRIIQCPQQKKTKYVGPYDKNGKRWCDLCLVIWNTDRPDVTNQGFAPGRCPDML